MLFENLNFSIPSGSLLYVRGLNGAGKSSLFKILSGLLAPDQGEVLWRDKSIVSCADEFHQELVFIGHKAAVNQQLTAIENLNYWRSLFPSDTDIDAMTLLGELGLVGLEDIPSGQLSAGQQRRVALARLWLAKGKLWILDEPFTALDKKLIQTLLIRMEQHLKGGGSIVVTSHQSFTLPSYPIATLDLEYRL